MQLDLWSFAVNLYRQDGVEQACLTAQAQGQNVCLLLCRAWLTQKQIGYSPEREAQLQDIVDQFEPELIRPLRSMRIYWKSQAAIDTEIAALREQLKNMELAAEKLLLRRLQQCTQQWRVNPAQYADWMAVLEPNSPLRAAIEDNPA